MGNPPTEIAFDWEERRLDNGLRVLLQRDSSSPLVAVHVMYHVGSKDERPGRTGFAHLFEHLLFQGSEHVPREMHFRHVQDAGGTLNGSTWFDRTNYFETLPSNELDLGLWLESDRMGWFESSITQEKLDNQREVVKNERRQSYENRPYGLAVETLLRIGFPEGHPYRHPTIGHMEDLDAASLEDVRDFFRKFYGPNNAVLVLAGDLPADAAERAAGWFGDIEPRRRPPEVEVPEPEAGSEALETLEDCVHVPRVYAMWHSPSFPEPEFEAMDVLAYVLADGKSSRLHRELIYERRVAGDVNAFTWPTESAGMFFAVATARPGVSAGALEESMDATIRRLVDEGPSDDELAGARNRARRDLVVQLHDVGSRADAFAHAATLRDDPGYVNDAFARYAAVDREATSELARRILRPEGRAVLHVVPGDEGPGAST